MGELFNFIFDGINDRYSHELMLISQQYPFEPIKYLRPTLRLTFEEGITLLRVSYLFSLVFSLFLSLKSFVSLYLITGSRN